MTDQQIYKALHDLDEKEADLNPWEVDFLASLLQREPVALSEKQRTCAIKLIEEHETEQRGGQEVQVRIPAEIQKHFRRQP